MHRYLMITVVSLVVLSGCGDRSKRTVGGGQAPTKGQISKEELRDELDRFEFLFISKMRQTVDNINAASGTHRDKRIAERTQARAIEALHAMTASDDAIVAFLDTWGLVMRIHLYYKGGPGSSVHGAQQPEVIVFIDESLDDIERIGRLFLPDEQFEKLKINMSRFAVQNPINETYSNLIVFATQQEEEKKGEGGALQQTLRFPMAPIRAMEGVDNTATAIHKVRNSVERFTDVAEQMPESTRWQMSILLDDIESAEMTQSLLKSLEDFSQSSTRLVEVLGAMPQEIRAELLTVLDESDQNQQQLQTTMKAASEAAERVEKVLTQLEATSQALNITVQQASDAGVTWKNASDSIQELIGMFKSDEPKDSNAPPGFGMRDFDAMLLNAGQTADKVGAVVAQLQQTVDAASKEEMQKQLLSLIDHVMWRLFELILAIVILVSGSRYVLKKLKPGKAKINQ